MLCIFRGGFCEALLKHIVRTFSYATIFEYYARLISLTCLHTLRCPLDSSAKNAVSVRPRPGSLVRQFRLWPEKVSRRGWHLSFLLAFVTGGAASPAPFHHQQVRL